jgi:hypothetical protein
VGLNRVLEGRPLMAAIAEGFALGMSATAERKSGSPAEAEGFRFLIQQLKVTLHHQRAIIGNGNLRCRHADPPVEPFSLWL